MMEPGFMTIEKETKKISMLLPRNLKNGSKKREILLPRIWKGGFLIQLLQL